MLNQFSRTQLVLGGEAMQVLARSRVAVFGIGGVGGYAVEDLTHFDREHRQSGVLHKLSLRFLS